MSSSRLIPLIIASALFMENMDSTVIATSLPAIARDLGTDLGHFQQRREVEARGEVLDGAGNATPFAKATFAL